MAIGRSIRREPVLRAGERYLMASLLEALTDEAKKPDVVKDCCALIDAEVKEKGGISGLAIKAGYGAVKGIKPGFVEHTVEDLLPEFAKALDPIYDDAKSQNKGVSDFFSSNSSRVADALLSITDAKAARAKSAVAKSAYDKLRSSAKKNVEQAVPRLGRLIEKYGN
jgi:hypothetical protein